MMESLIIACIQQRNFVPPSHEEFEVEVRRFLRQAQAKAVRLTVFPELTGVMLSPALISGLKRSFIGREDRGKRRDAGVLSRGLGRLAGSTGGAIGGGFRGSLIRLLRKNSDSLRDSYLELFGRLAREFSTAIVGGSLYLYDHESDSVRHRAYVFDVDGTVLGYQDKLNLSPDERDLAVPGSGMDAIETRYGRIGLLIGRDALYPELGRALAMQGADLFVGIAASPGAAQAKMHRAAMALRAEENQVFATTSFLLGPNYLGVSNREDYFGQSALLAPISLTKAGSGVLIQAGTDRTEGIIAAELPTEELATLRQTSGFQPRSEIHLGNLGALLADVYRQGLAIEQAIEQDVFGPADSFSGWDTFKPVDLDTAESGELALDTEPEPEPEAPDLWPSDIPTLADDEVGAE
jgi:predicted amidohydrolase